MKRWRSQSDSHRFPASVEYESALAGPAAGRAGPDHLSGPLRPVQCAGVGGEDRIPGRYGDPQAALLATAALLGGYRSGPGASRTPWWDGRRDSRGAVVAREMQPGAGRALDAPGVQVHARDRCTGDAQAEGRCGAVCLNSFPRSISGWER